MSDTPERKAQMQQLLEELREIDEQIDYEKQLRRIIRRANALDRGGFDVPNMLVLTLGEDRVNKIINEELDRMKTN